MTSLQDQAAAHVEIDAVKLQAEIEAFSKEFHKDSDIRELKKWTHDIVELLNRIFQKNFADNAKILHAHNAISRLDALKALRKKIQNASENITEDDEEMGMQFDTVADLDQSDMKKTDLASICMAQMAKVFTVDFLQNALGQSNSVDLLVDVFNTKVEKNQIKSVILDADNFAFKNPFPFNINVRIGTRKKGEKGSFEPLKIGLESEHYEDNSDGEVVELLTTLTAETCVERPVPASSQWAEQKLHELTQGNFIDAQLQEAFERPFQDEDIIYDEQESIKKPTYETWFTVTIVRSHPICKSLEANKLLQQLIYEKFKINIKKMIKEKGINIPLSVLAFIAKMYHDDQTTLHTITPQREAVLRLYRADNKPFFEDYDGSSLHNKLLAVKFIFYYALFDSVKAMTLNVGDAVLFASTV